MSSHVPLEIEISEFSVRTQLTLVERFELIVQNIGEQSLRRRVLTSDHENIVRTRMTLYVADDEWLTIVGSRIGQKRFRMEHCGILGRTRTLILPIEVDPCHAASLVPACDAVWIQHRNSVEHELLSKRHGSWMIL